MKSLAASLWTIGMLLGLSVAILSQAQAVTPQISAGVGSTAILKQDGTMWGVGSITGAGVGAIQPARLFPAISDVIQISTAGADYALRANGELWASGRNELGQIGDGTTVYRANPYKVMDGVIQFSASDKTALALRRDGTAWAWGDNTFGQLGDGTRTSRLLPVRIMALANIVMLGAGNKHGAALTSDGHVWVWGSRDFFADGDPNHYPADDPRSEVLTPTQIPNLVSITSIAAGSGGNLALDANGKLWSHGLGLGMSGNGTTSNALNLPVLVSVPGKVSAYSVGWTHDLAVTEDGSVWAWGRNSSGQLGLPFSGINPTPAKISFPGPAIGVAAGWTYSAILLADGRVMTFGDDNVSQLGRGLFQSDHVPGFMVSETGGGNFNASTPAPANLPSPPTLQISAASAVNGIVKGVAPLTVPMTANGSAASGHSIVSYDWVSSDGSVLAKGSSVNLTFTKPGAIDVYAVATDDLGLRRATSQHIMALPPDIAVSVTPQIVSAGSGIGLNALSSKGTVYSWGAPFYLGSQEYFGGGLGTPFPVDPGLRGIVKLASAGSTSIALTQGGLVLAWAFNTDGALGIGSTIPVTLDPVLVTLPKAATNIVGGGSNQAFALLSDGTVWAWGGNDFGQLGFADAIARSTPEQIPGLANIVAITASYRNGYAIDRDGTVWAWGDNSLYQLGQGDKVSRLGVVKVGGLPPVAKMAAGDGHVLVITRDGRIFGWSNWNVSLGDTSLPGQPVSPVQVPALSSFTDFVSGAGYTLGVKADGSVWTWGQNGSGQMPGSTAKYEPSPIRVAGVMSPLAMTTSNFGGAIVLNDGHVVAWGLNNRGQIGDGTFARRPSPVLVVNTSVDGYLNLSTVSAITPPAELKVPFFVVAAGDVSSSSATLGTTINFSASSLDKSGTTTGKSGASADTGPSGSVYVTGWVPRAALATLGITSPDSSLVITRTSDNPKLVSAANLRVSQGTLAETDASSFVLVQKTAAGWQLVVNGQLIPYATGVLNDQLAAQKILDGTDTTNLKGAVFCLGYGSSAPEMTASGRMRAVATIPDPNATVVASVSCIVQGVPVALRNFSDSWWNQNESGWGITITDHGSNAFVQWYAYDQTGHNQKYVISGAFSADKCQFSGPIGHVTGPGWTQPSFDPAQVVRTTVGSGTIDFCPAGLAANTIVFSYTADGVMGSKQLTRLGFGNDVPHLGGTANTGAADYTDLWWNAAESGWGVSLTQHGSTAFFRIFVYDTDGRPLLFIVSSAASNGGTTFTGPVTLTTGPWFGSNPFDPGQVVRTSGGTATLTFSDANNGMLSYTINGVTKTKAITRLVF